MSWISRVVLLCSLIGHAVGVSSWYDVYVEGMETPSRAHVLDVVNDFNATGDGETINTENFIAAVAIRLVVDFLKV